MHYALQDMLVATFGSSWITRSFEMFCLCISEYECRDILKTPNDKFMCKIN